MKQFKKRTLALVLASVVTVVGAFGAENYKNSLMSLKFESRGSGAVNLTVLTKRDYPNSITPVKKDASTYVITLPETNSEMSSPADISGDVESVDVRTMPYTKNSRGYTRITIRTLPNTMITAGKGIYIPEKTPTETAAIPASPVQQPNVQPQPQPQPQQQPQMPQQQPQTNNESAPNEIQSRTGVSQTNPVDIRESVKQFEQTPTEPQMAENAPAEETVPQSSSSSSETVLVLLGVVLAIVISVYFVLRARDKMAEITGEQSDFDTNIDEFEPKKKKVVTGQKQKIKNTIKTLDKMYTKPVKMPVKTDLVSQVEPAKETKPEEELNIVDLDELFQEKTKQEDENSALEDFLNSFSFQEEEEEIPEEESFDEELYEKYINDDHLKFSQEDIGRINQLLNSEISDDTMKNLQSFVVSNPIEKKPSRTEILENFVTTYTINQNITFTKEDVDALYKLISVEIDPDFLNDLRCNPHRMEEMQKEMAKQKVKPHKTSELLTLNVKDMLPDLSEALRKQGGKAIESEVKPQVVYYSDGYDVSTLKLDEDLPDLSKEINNADAYKTRPSDKIQYVASGYDVDTMSVTDDLPDLRDVLMNPEKYETKPEEPVAVDENALLNNLANVTFKPFDDGYNAPTVSDMQEEFNQLGGSFEIVNEEEIPEAEQNDNDDFAALYDDNYVDLDKEENNNRSEDAQKLIELIEQKRAAKKIKQELPPKQEKPVKKDIATKKPNKNCAIGGEIYTIIASTNFTDNTGCYLAKNSSGYYVLGFVDKKTFKIKFYDKLKSERLDSRISDKLDNGALRYIVRIGEHKLIMKANGEKMEYVMDLC